MPKLTPMESARALAESERLASASEYLQALLVVGVEILNRMGSAPAAPLEPPAVEPANKPAKGRKVSDG